MLVASSECPRCAIRLADKPRRPKCMDCVDSFCREVHVLRFGEEHQMEFTRVARNCNVCRGEILGDFIKCAGCFNAFDMCLNCAVRARMAKPNSLEVHFNAYGREHTFRHINWDASTPAKEPLTIDVPNTNAYKCAACHIKLSGTVLSCLECSSRPKDAEDLCLGCVERGKMARHVKRTGHHFILFNLHIGEGALPVASAERNDVPPPYGSIPW
ncbi:hypothetical protein M408DRAFT_238709 [Serendipita vermifera MAFF 305830]|uniref:ZZ-type domain-containing protein n=1 Tax=Serendipita vermifera MAFF 305830 TaxID=933852 RepID=A0A0C3B4N0_SERVB|nr:hypothetical protein M408DRAFT_238709 [Serendipita vermifera MAFF 305830]